MRGAVLEQAPFPFHSGHWVGGGPASQPGRPFFAHQQRNRLRPPVFPSMMHTRKLVLSCLIVFILDAAVRVGRAEGSPNPYRNIVSSNVFRLKPIETGREEQAPRPTARIRLVGITTILGYKLASLRLQLPTTPPEPGKELCCMLAEGQREGEVEILAIDEKAGSVKVSNYGTEVVLTFDTGNSSPPATAPPSRPPLHLPTRMVLNSR